MSRASDRLHASLIEPLGAEVELRLAAAAAIDTLAAEAAPDDLEELAARLERRKPRTPWLRRGGLLLVGLVVLGLGVVAVAGFWRMLAGELAPSLRVRSDMEAWLARAPVRVRQVLGRPTGAQAAGAAWQAAPDNPQRLAAHALESYDGRGELPDGFLADAARVAPENGYFPATAAGVLAGQALEREGEINEAGLYLREIRDADSYTEAIRLLHVAANQSEFANPWLAVERERLALLPPVVDARSFTIFDDFLEEEPSFGSTLIDLRHLVASEANRLAARGEGEAFVDLLGAWERLARLQLAGSHHPFDLEVAGDFLTDPLPVLIDAARRLELNEVAERLVARQARLEEFNQRSESAASDAPGGYMLEKSRRHTGFLRSLRYSPDQLTISRRIDQAVADRAYAVIAALALLGAALTASLFQWRCSTLARRLARPLAGQFSVVDWLWVGWLGILMPLAGLAVARVVIIERIFAAKPDGHIVIWGALVVILLCLPAVVVRWRLGRRCRALGLPRSPGWLTANVGVALLAAGMFDSSPGGYLLRAAVAWVALAGLCGLLGNPARLLGRACLCRLLVPAYAGAALAVAVCLPLLYAEERHWIASDPAFDFAPRFGGLSQYDFAGMEKRKAEVLREFDGGS